jgi:hypothetical protein
LPAVGGGITALKAIAMRTRSCERTEDRHLPSEIQRSWNIRIKTGKCAWRTTGTREKEKKGGSKSARRMRPDERRRRLIGLYPVPHAVKKPQKHNKEASNDGQNKKQVRGHQRHRGVSCS